MEDYAVATRGAYLKSYLCRFDERNIVVYVSNGYIVGHREVIAGHGIADHTLHVGMVGVGFIVGELADDKAAGLV